MAVIYLIRHGQASWGKADYDDLSATGIAQSQHLGSVLLKRIGRPDMMQREDYTAPLEATSNPEPRQQEGRLQPGGNHRLFHPLSDPSRHCPA